MDMLEYKLTYFSLCITLLMLRAFKFWATIGLIIAISILAGVVVYVRHII